MEKFDLRNNNLGINIKKKKYVVLFVLTALVSFILGVNVRNFLPVAIVNGENIATPLFAKELLKFGGRPVMTKLIAEKLIYQEAKKKNIKISKKEIKDKVTQVEDQLKKQHLTLQVLLLSQNQTRSEFEHEIELQFIIDKLFKDNLNVSDRDIEIYFVQAGIKKGEGAIYESQKIAITNNIRRDKLRNALAQWIAAQKNSAKVQFLIKL